MKFRGKKKIIAVLMAVLAMGLLGGCKKDAATDSTVAPPEETKALTREELLFGDIWLCGEKITFPCKVKELPQGFTITRGVVVTDPEGNMARIDLLYHGQVVGAISIYGVDKGFGGYYDFSSGYEEYDIRVLEGKDIVIRGITSQSSEEDIMNTFGKPDVYREGRNLTYILYDGSESLIDFFYSSVQEGKLDITIFYWEDEKDE